MYATTAQHENAEQSDHPSLADIVRQETDNGRTIVRFYRDVVDGKLEDFDACHRLDAAKQLHMIAPDLVADFIAQSTGVQCRHAARRQTRPTTVVPAQSLPRTRYGAGTHPGQEPAAVGRGSDLCRRMMVCSWGTKLLEE